MALSWDPGIVRYPDARIKSLDPRFQPLVLSNAAVEQIASGCRFNEGPVWFGDLRCLIWSDIPNDRMMKWEEETGAVSVFRKPSHYANGNTRDRQGRLVTCEMDTQRLTRTEYDGTMTILAETFDGKKLTGPNDVVVKSDGSIWFSDNGAGIRGNYLGHKATPELPYRVYRLDASTGQLTIAVGDMKRPNGLAFHPTRGCSTLLTRRARCSGRSRFTTSSTTVPGPRTGASSAAQNRAAAMACESMSTAICGAAGP